MSFTLTIKLTLFRVNTDIKYEFYMAFFNIASVSTKTPLLRFDIYKVYDTAKSVSYKLYYILKICFAAAVLI